MLAGLVMSCIFAVFVLYFESDTMVVGIALNLASWGITTFLLSAIFNVRGVFIDPRIKSFQTVEIPLIKEIRTSEPWSAATTCWCIWRFSR